MLRRFACGLSVTLATSASETRVHAADGTRFHLSYSAPDGCPSRAQVLAQLYARASHLVEAAAEDTAPRFVIEVSRDEATVLASVEMTLLDGAYSRRVLRADDCGEAVAAATVIVALVLAPQQGEAAAPKRADAPQQRTDAQSAYVAEQRKVVPDASRPKPAPRTKLDAAEMQFEIDAGGQLGVPASMLGGTLGGGGFVEGQFYPERSLSPSVRLALLTQAVELRSDRGTAEIRLTTARLSVCPVRLPVGSRAFLRPCALGELGRLRGQGKDTPTPREVITSWRALGASLQGVWSFPVVAMELELAAVFPLTRESFYFDPTPVAPIFEAPSVQASVLAGLSAHFP